MADLDVTRADAVLIGGGIASATLAAMLTELEPDWDIVVLERLDSLGAESSDAATERVTAQRQTDQLVPVIEELAAAGVATSVESYHPTTVEACLKAGAAVVNLSGSADDEEMFGLAAAYGASVVLCANLDPAKLDARAGSEKVTVVLS